MSNLGAFLVFMGIGSIVLTVAILGFIFFLEWIVEKNKLRLEYKSKRTLRKKDDAIFDNIKECIGDFEGHPEGN